MIPVKFEVKSHNKAVFSVVLIIAIMSALFAYNGYFAQYQSILKNATQQNVLMEKIYLNNQKYLTYFFEFVASTIKSNPTVIKALNTENPDIIEQEVMKTLLRDKRIKDYDNVGFIYLPGHNRLTFFNHTPETSAASIDPMIKETIDTGESQSGYEIYSSDLYKMFTIPLYNKNKIEGVVKIGVNIRKRCLEVSNSIDASSAIYIYNKNSAGLSPSNIKIHEKFVLICKDKMPFSELAYNYTFNTFNRLVKVKDKHFSIISGPKLTNYVGEEIGFIAIAYDSSYEINNIDKMHLNFIIITLIMCSLAFLLLQFNFGSLLKKIEKANSNLTIQHFTDSLTGLPNRHKLFKDMEVAVRPYIMMINIDRFKEINEVFGIAIGDLVLKKYGELLVSYMKELTSKFPELSRQYTVYRLGRDEFIVLLDHINRFNFAVPDHIAHKTDYEVLTFNDIDISISVTIGISNESERILQCADIALKEARSRKLKFLKFHDSFDVFYDYANNIAWFNKVKKAIANDRVIPFYQPIINNKNDKIEKYECLIRLKDEDGNIIPPGLFLNIIKKTRLYPELTRIVLTKSIQNFNDKNCSFSINLSMEDIHNQDLMDFIVDEVSKMKKPEALVFEIVETEGINNYDEVNNFIIRVKHFGCKIAIDDFGTGYSSFEYLLNLGVDYLKIDGSLIKNILIDKNAYHIVHTISQFTQKIGIKTIAEFIETKELQEAVKELEIDYSQGYYFSPPREEAEDC